MTRKTECSECEKPNKGARAGKLPMEGSMGGGCVDRGVEILFCEDCDQKSIGGTLKAYPTPESNF